MVATAAWMAVSIGGGVLAASAGLIADDHAGPAVAALAITLVGIVVSLSLGKRGRGRVYRSAKALAAGPTAEVPAPLHIGTRRPALQAAAVLTALAVLMIALPLINSNVSGWIIPEIIGVATLIHYALTGPSAYLISSAQLDPPPASPSARSACSCRGRR
jgi:hypothetical protein